MENHRWKSLPSYEDERMSFRNQSRLPSFIKSWHCNFTRLEEDFVVNLSPQKSSPIAKLPFYADDLIPFHHPFTPGKGTDFQLPRICCHGQMRDKGIFRLSRAGGNNWKLGSGDNPVSVEVKPRLIVNNARAGRELVRAGHGIGLLPSFAIANDIKKGRLQRLLPEYASEAIGIYAVYQHRKHLSAKTRLFIEEMHQYFQADAHQAF